MTRWTTVALTFAMAWGAAPIGTVVSVAPVAINGAKVMMPSVFFWPVVAGDGIATTTSTGTLVLYDKSRIVLDRNTSVRVDGSTLTLEHGRIGYSLAPHSHLVIVAATSRLDGAKPTGVVTLNGSKLTFVPGSMKFSASEADPPPRDLPLLGNSQPAHE